MIRKIGALIAFCGGAYFGYTHALDIVEYSGSNQEDPFKYWSSTGTATLEILMTVGCGVIAAAVVYFLLNLFARND